MSDATAGFEARVKAQAVEKHISSDEFGSSGRRGGGLSLATPARDEASQRVLNDYQPDNLITLAAAVIERAVRDARSKNPARAESARCWLAGVGADWVELLGLDGEAVEGWVEELPETWGKRE